MTDQEKIETKLAHAFCATVNHGEDHHMMAVSFGFKAGIDYRDKNPGPHVMALVEAASMVCKYTESEGCLDELHDAIAAFNEAVK